jgi:predicted 3-demethylubiquinone-9 3-methyltransferase (glyoxalase superfamily)
MYETAGRGERCPMSLWWMRGLSGDSNVDREEREVQGITPFLWFDSEAEEAANFYTSVFPNSRILKTTRYGEAGPREAGSVMTVDFELDGRDFVALNGGPEFTFTEAVSFLVNCEDQDEVDELWDQLSEGGEKGPCGWLKDKYGLSWQVVPIVLSELLSDPDPAKSQRVTQAMLQMSKLEIEPLRRAYEGAEAPARS